MIKVFTVDTSYIIFKHPFEDKLVCYYDTTYKLDNSMSISKICKTLGISPDAENKEFEILAKIEDNVDYLMYKSIPIIDCLGEKGSRSLLEALVETELAYDPLYPYFKHMLHPAIPNVKKEVHIE